LKGFHCFAGGATCVTEIDGNKGIQGQLDHWRNLYGVVKIAGWLSVNMLAGFLLICWLALIGMRFRLDFAPNLLYFMSQSGPYILMVFPENV
jgi:hypothetical protein